MSTITLPNIRVSSDLTAKLKLKDGGVALDWSTLSNIRVSIYSDAQRALAGRCSASIDAEDPTLLVCTYAANKPQYVGVNRVVVSAKYMGETKTYDKPAFNFVRWTDDQAGQTITIDDPDIDVEISVEDVSSSILQEAVDAAFEAAERANDAAEAAEHMVDIHTGPAGKSPYIGENGHWWEWDEETDQYVDTEINAKGDTGETPDITIGTVTTAEPGTPAAATMTGTPEDPVLNLTIPKGAVGATPNFTIGTVTTGEPGTPVVVTLTGTPEAPVLNITIPQGMQGNTGSSVDYPYELVNNLTTNDATKGLSAAQGKVLKDELSQLEAKISKIAIPSTGTTGYFINLNGDIGDTISLTPTGPVSIPWKIYIQDVAPGDIVTVSGEGGAQAKLWGFIDSSNKLLSVADASVSETNLDLVAPTNAAKVIINDKTDQTQYYLKKDCIENQLKLKADKSTVEALSIVSFKQLQPDVTVGMLDTNGEVQSSFSQRRTSDFIPFDKDVKIYNSFTPSDTTNYKMACLYDDTKTFVSAINGPTANHTYEEYIIKKADYPTAAFLRYALASSSAQCKVDYLGSIQDAIDDAETKLDALDVSYNPSVVVGSLQVNGEVGTSLTYRRTSDFIPFLCDLEIHNAFQGGTPSAYTMACVYAADKSLVGYITGPSLNKTVASYKIAKASYPTGAYVRYCLASSSEVCKVTYTAPGNLILDSANQTFRDGYIKNYGKSIGILGGSFSVIAPSEAAKEIWKRYLRCTITNYGESNAGFSSLQTGLYGHSIQDQADNAGVHDIYILWASTNDYGYNQQLGEYSDYTALDNYDEAKRVTQCGGINYCIKTLLTKNPNAEIYFFTSLRFFSSEAGYNPFSTIVNGVGKKFSEYVEGQKRCCEYYGIPLLDLYNLQGVNVFNYSLYYQNDNHHMNDAGYMKIGALQAEFLANGLG
jgi:hypothetical protein